MLWVMRYIKLLFIITVTSCGDYAPARSQYVDSQSVDYSLLPSKCRRYVNLFQQSENPSRFMAQMEQESACDPFAESPFAKGLMQFTDQTGEWLSLTHCKRLGDYKPFDPAWSTECSKIYMALKQSDNNYSNYCFNKKVAEQEYNGGNWVVWELRMVNNSSLFESSLVCGKIPLHNGRKRASWACKENYEYPDRISQRQFKYLGFGGFQCD